MRVSSPSVLSRTTWRVSRRVACCARGRRSRSSSSVALVDLDAGSVRVGELTIERVARLAIGEHDADVPVRALVDHEVPAAGAEDVQPDDLLARARDLRVGRRTTAQSRAPTNVGGVDPSADVTLDHLEPRVLEQGVVKPGERRVLVADVRLELGARPALRRAVGAAPASHSSIRRSASAGSKVVDEVAEDEHAARREQVVDTRRGRRLSRSRAGDGAR